MEIIESISPLNSFLIGLILGFLFSLFILDMFYKQGMKYTISEIHKNYCKALNILKKENNNAKENS